jgi:hypothetical protein
MKKLLFTFILLSWIGVPINSIAQGQCNLGGCVPGGFNYPGGIFSTVSSTFTVVANDIVGGNFSLYNVTAGSTYEWSMCASDGGVCNYNGQLTLYNNSNFTFPVCYSDDFCGDDPKIQWTATFTGVVRIKVTQFNCVNNVSLSTLVWRCASCGPIPATCVDNDDCNAPTVIPFTPGTPQCIIDCTNGSNPGPNFPGTNCQDFPNPTVWFQLTTGATATSMNIGLTSATMINPYFSVFTTSNCFVYNTINCTQGNSGSVSATVQLNPFTTYLIAVSNNGAATGYFNMCILVNNDISACNTNNSLSVTATSMGSPFSGPFQQGEQVTFCYNVTNFQQVNCNYLQGIVPTFGNGWDPSSFNGLGMPVNVSTSIATAGTLQLIPLVNDVCAGSPSGAWSWFPSGSATYNILFNGQLLPNTNLPGGWFFLNSFDPLTGFCSPDPLDPDFSLGDGNFNACLPNTFDWQVCFRLTAGGPTQCSNGTPNCSVTIRTFADGEIGAWTDDACADDGTGAETFSTTICCTSAPAVTPSVSYCRNAPAVPLTAVGSNLLWYTTATGGVGSPVPPTPNTTVAGTFQFFVSQNNGLCEGPRATITVTVTAPPSATISYPAPLCSNLVGPQVVTRTGTAGGTYSSTAGLTLNTANGSITPATSLAGNYIVTYTIPAAGGCPSFSTTANVTITPAPALSPLFHD